MVVKRLSDCTAGEHLAVSFSRSATSALYSESSYQEYSAGNTWYAPSITPDEEQDRSALFTVPADGTWVLVVIPDDELSVVLDVTLQRTPVDAVLWNQRQSDCKIARKQPTPGEAPMASTLFYWEHMTGHRQPPTDLCPICGRVLKRTEARCALVTIPGQLPIEYYVLPVCPHCYATANGKTFLIDPHLLSKAPR